MTHRIQNYDTLATSDLRRDALALIETGYDAIDVGKALARAVRIEGDELVIACGAGNARRPLRGRRVFFVGIGKCAAVAAGAIETILGDRLTGGVALDVSNTADVDLRTITLHIGTHPLPSEENTRATERILSFLAETTEDDLVLMLISGGGSTLICAPEAPMTCLDERDIFTALTDAGASIEELNTVRKHLSRARGGGLARAAYPAEVVSLIVSDVPGNDLEYISSGPTVRDDSTVADARAILARYGVAGAPTLAFIETPKEEKYFARVSNTLFLTNETALDAMRDAAEARGYAATIVTDRLTGEARAVARDAAEALHAAAPKTVLLYAGETTINLGDHPEKGGRNQEVALAALRHVAPGELIAPFASDGHDNTDHAGALADEAALAHAKSAGLSIDDALAHHGTYAFFSATGDTLITGYTGSNVSDLIIAIKR